MFRMLILGLALALMQITNPPTPEPECLTPWVLIWQFENSKYCDGNTYQLYACRIQKWSEFRQEYYYTQKAMSTCIGHVERFPPVPQFQYLPLLSKGAE